MRSPTTMLARSGVRIDLVSPRPEQISMADIAHHLSCLCRFTGAVATFYSVAQHSVLVSRLVPQELALPALLHDAHEAYLGDMGTPLKRAIESEKYSVLRARFDIAICERFGVDVDLLNHPEVKKADLIALATERRDLMPPDSDDIWSILDGVEPDQERIDTLEPAYARTRFVEEFRRLLTKETAHD